MTPTGPHLVLAHSIVGRDALVNFEFDPRRDHRACLICGEVFQSWLDRLECPTKLEYVQAAAMRQEWAVRHARSHSSREHELLKMSGRLCTPEAAEFLVPLGIAPVSDMVLSDEHEHAALQAKRAPINDVETHF